MKNTGVVEVAFGSKNGKKGLWLKLNEPIPFEWEKDGKRFFLDLSTRAEKAYSMYGKRKKHSNAYLPWTKEDDDKLECLFSDGTGVKQMCEELGRNRGAVEARIKKLEEIYGGLKN
jgi:hypothetical protein